MGMSTEFVLGPTTTQEVPAVTTTQRLVALEDSGPEGVPVATAIAITSAASILSALLFAVGLFTAWTYRKKWAEGSEGVQDQSRDDGAELVLDHPESTQNNETVDEAVVGQSLPPGSNNNNTEGGLYPMRAADDDSLRGSSVDEKEFLEHNNHAEAPSSTQLLVMTPVGAATGSGSQSVSSHSHENVLSWSPVDVQRWMDSVGFRREVVGMFKAHGIDGSRLLGLTDHILENEIGLTSAALRASILSVRARFFLEPRLPADAAADGSTLMSPGQARRERDAAAREVSPPDNGVLRIMVSSAAIVNEGVNEQEVDDAKESERDQGSEPPPDYGVRRRSATYFLSYHQEVLDSEK
ncbi:hypothetical protein HDU96_001082 [Phlyctochytrium bullatum]|nr:hypothetical protein HDU96_001082 [Phlyctochytrium bullatum]